MGERVAEEVDVIDEFYISNWEREMAQEVDGQEDMTLRLSSEMEAANHKLWAIFQAAAECVAVMYKGAADRHNSVWVPFQTAAGQVTSLYKEAIDTVRRTGEIGAQAGYQRRTREMLNWARRRRHIRREELLAFLAGKSPPPHRPSHLRGSPRTRISLERGHGRLPSPRLPSPHHNSSDPDLNTFREALGISGQRSGGVVGSGRRTSPPCLPHGIADLQSFIHDEFARNKRPASPSHDVIMDSPQHKRSRFT